MPAVIAFLGVLGFLALGSAFVDWMVDGKPTTIIRILKFRPKTPKALQPHVRRVQKMEKDAQAVLDALKNLHETKKRINAEYRENWDNEFRLLLPPPATPNRQAVRWKPYYGHEPFELYFSPSSGIKDKRVEFPTSHTPVPVGAIKRMGEWWYGFNNLPGHPHRMMFQRIRCFHEIDDEKFWAFLPTIRETHEGYVWEDKKAKVLASNIFEGIKDRISS